MLVGPLLLFSLLSGPSPAGEDPRPHNYSLHWSAPTTCPDAEAVSTALEQLFPDLDPDATPLEVEAEVTELPSGSFAMVLQTRFRGAEHSRRLDDEDCDAFVEATATVVGLSLSSLEPALIPQPPAPPSAPSKPSANEPRTEASNPPPATTPPRTLALGTPAQAPPKERAVGLRIGAGVESGALSRPSGYVTGGAVLDFGRLSLRGHLSYVTPRPVPGVGSTVVDLLAAAMRACAVATQRPLQPAVCGGVEGGVTTFRRVAPGSRSVARGPWLGPLVAFSARTSGEQVRLWTAVEGVARLVGARGTTTDGEVFRPWPVSARWLLGLEVSLS